MRRAAAVVPIKSFGRAKSRLAGHLPDDVRSALAERMATRVLSAIRASSRIDDIIVVTDGDEPAKLAARFDAQVVRDPPDADLAAVVRAGLAAVSSGLDRAIVVMGDLPSIEVGDVDAILEALDSANVVLVPDAAGLGTSALGLRPIDVIPVAFGGGRSLGPHRAAAAERGAALVELDLPGLAYDVDTPEDVRR